MPRISAACSRRCGVCSRPDGLFFARLASTIGLERLVGAAGRRVRLPDGTERFVVDEAMLRDWTERLGGEWLDPLKTTNVQQQRCMTTWCLRKPGQRRRRTDVALTATIYNLDIDLADADRACLRVAGAARRAPPVRVRRVPGDAHPGVRARVSRGHRLLAGPVRSGRTDDLRSRSDRRDPVVDRHRDTGCRAPAQGVQGRPASGGVHAQGSRATGQQALGRADSSCWRRSSCTPSTGA